MKTGDYVVHFQHGVARFEGVTTRTMGGTTRDYLILQYRGSDRLYLPVEQIEAITPYSGGESPTLSRLGAGSDWQRQKARVRAAVREIAQELVVLYRRRMVAPGHAFSADTPWQVEMEQAFHYPETRDQLRAIDEVKGSKGDAPLLVAPYPNAAAERSLPAGTMVLVGSRYDSFVHVRDGDGQAGWVPRASIECIADPRG